MSQDKETPVERQERLRQEELKKSPLGNLGDSYHRAQHGDLAGLSGRLGWKGLLITIVILIAILVVLAIL
ncbi:DUF6366 family protein [Alkalihalobacillus pseudalcaliphilus]|uniref:DUF6366 family protein n=1 Tax=Alkalihalobacillus pseudalcaliphilus TaxID=79884 RepID=UPI00064D82DB|nr:DUF6366 family protein [Alkalihalobacillus pseudalcaliphilus]KMK75807.1 phage capsid protein [Alkalihalobacillus pseudalcaliphilus]